MHFTYAAYCLAIADDFCLKEGITSLLRQGVEKVLIVSPSTYWSTGEPQKPADLAQLQQIAADTGAALIPCEMRASGHAENASIYTEGLYRTHAVNWLREHTMADFFITLDADELWFPGTLAHIDTLVRGGPCKVNLPCIPTIGVPGLPIEGAKDVVGVATSRHLNFKWGRAPDDALTLTGTQPVIHFSATRRTLEQVVQKHRLSAHYSDPTYDFEGWIANTLPRVCVGMRDAHMYKSPENIWPLVRAWKPEELALIPQSLYQYLSIP